MLIAAPDDKCCVRGKKGDCRNTEECYLKLEVICSEGFMEEAALEGRVKMRARYLDQWREAVGFISRELGLILERSG